MIRRFFKKIVHSNNFLTALLHRYQIRKVLNIFYFKDFEFIKLSSFRYRLIFNNNAGYYKDNYNPEFEWNSKDKLWNIHLGGFHIKYKYLPLFELINELRGYMLWGDLKSGDIVIDAGASMGLQSCYFAFCVGPTGKVFCLEPLSEAVESISNHIVLNHLENIKIVNKALLNTNGTMSFAKAGGASALSLEATENMVETVSILSFIDQQGIDKSKIRFIKMDIEGSEFDILEDILALVSDNKSLVVAIASYHERNGVPSYKYIEEICAASNYNVFVKTLYPYHATTYITSLNNELARKIDLYPSYQETKNRVWHNTTGL